MSTKAKEMGEESGGASRPREMGNVAMHVRDDSAEYLLYVRERLARVITNEIDDQPSIEGICGEAFIAISDVLMAYQTIGARIRPEAMVEQKLNAIRKQMPTFRLVAMKTTS